MTKAKVKKAAASKFLIGAGVAAAVAAGVVSFLTQTKHGKDLVKTGKAHASDMANEVAKRAEKAVKMTKASYEKMIDEVVKEYTEKKKMTEKAAAVMAKELKKEWVTIQKELKK